MHDKLADVYGVEHFNVLTALQSSMEGSTVSIAAQFYDELERQSVEGRVLLSSLTDDELEHLKLQQSRNVLKLASPGLCMDEHREFARRVGRVHVMVGLTQGSLLLSQDLLHAAVRDHVDTERHREGLSLLVRRLLRDLTWQTEAYQELQQSRHRVLSELGVRVRTAESYSDCLSQCVKILGTHDEIAACGFAKPGQSGRFRFEFVAGAPELLASLGEREMPSLRPSEAAGAMGEAWRTGEPVHVRNCALDERLAPWREVARRAGVRSMAAVPILTPQESAPCAMLSLYSRYPGGFDSAEQRAFLEQVQALLGFAYTRFDTRRRDAEVGTIPYSTRWRWAELLRGEGLEMHYQPIVELRSGRLRKVEALARLRDGERLLTPNVFFPALTADDFVVVYARGLAQALTERRRWLCEDGLDVHLSVNLPSSALADARYFEVTRELLAGEGEDPKLTLEILESDALPAEIDIGVELRRFRALGVSLAEDDLGSGHSGLSRLRQLPFDVIKLDRGLIALTDHEPTHTLRFVYQLTRLGHSLGKEVIVEGVESAELLEAIAVLGADGVQGYVLAKPMSAPELRRWIAAQIPLVLPDPKQPRSVLAKLATLLLWEERLHSLLGRGELSTEPALLNAILDGLGNQPLAKEPAPTRMPGLGLPFVEPALQRKLLGTAVSHGLLSQEYGEERERLLCALRAAS